MNNLSITNFNRKHLKQSHEHKLAELIDEVRACVGADATLAAKVGFNPRKMLNKFKILIEKVINNIKIERQQAILEQASQNIVDQLDLQLATITERSSVFQNYLELLASGSRLLRSDECEHSNALSDWLDEIDPLPQVEDFNQMPFQSLKADPNNVPRDFSVEEEYSAHTHSAANIDNFFLPEYIESKNEAEITEDILAKANELKNSPVKIYEWVRNNIEWQPTWGGQQTAGMTLGVLRGNAMDISTLLIALLRAAKIPARYVHGTVDIEINTFMNMAGNFDSLNAAIEFVSAGGVPVTGIISGGKISKVRMEHVWVEAAVPFYPSRGSKPVSKRNPIDKWVPLDGSAKEYEFCQGIDVFKTSLNFDDVLEKFKNSGVVNNDKNFISGFDSSILKKAQEKHGYDLYEHLFENIKEPKIPDLIGKRNIIPLNFNFLPGSLPYMSISRGIGSSFLKAELQTKINLSLNDESVLSEYDNNITMPLYKLNQKEIIISFVPARESDEMALKEQIPKNLTDLNQLPNFYSSYIQMIPIIKLNKRVILKGSQRSIGEEIKLEYQFKTPTKTYLNVRNKIIVGSYLALGIVGSNFSNKTIFDNKNELNKIKAIIENNKDNKLTGDELIKGIYYTGIQNYYCEYISQSELLSIGQNIRYMPQPMGGTFGYEPRQKMLFGVNLGIETGGLYMNVHVAQSVKDPSGKKDKAKEFMMQIGMLSSTLEHTVPESLFNGKKNQIVNEGFSASKAITMALAQGQKIYTITKNNIEQTLANIKINKLGREEIRAAVYAGKEVRVHAEPLTINKYSGSGYIILDPIIGDGAYKISGGKNGGFLDPAIKSFTENANLIGVILGAIAIMGFFAGWAPLTLVIIFLLQTYLLVIDLLTNYEPCTPETDFKVFFMVLFVTVIAGAVGLIVEVGANIIMLILGLIYGSAPTSATNKYCNIIKTNPFPAHSMS
ncbi:transglutaminase-like domain-containing protein [Snodgrassella alvi]|uniref:transglutaminase-like domain-containing protein n=1 Tax=Snodgrassella alvi TaxID=1196083 RepID=UPI000C1EE1A2|nr:transglutaminase-like domain-containing protein [Snodgrassella alvi]PIT49267.1 hypothetical protein BHC51_04090 [Snodgrassella alvi]